MGAKRDMNFKGYSFLQFFNIHVLSSQKSEDETMDLLSKYAIGNLNSDITSSINNQLLNNHIDFKYATLRMKFDIKCKGIT